MTDPAEMDLEALRKNLEARPAFGWFQTTIDHLIANVEALRKRVAELEAFHVDPNCKAKGCLWVRMDAHATSETERAEAAEAHAVELAGALTGWLNAQTNSAAQDAAKAEARAALAATPPEALERARARGAIIDIAREIVSTESAWTSEWVAKDRALKNAFAKLDAFQKEPKT